MIKLRFIGEILLRHVLHIESFRRLYRRHGECYGGFYDLIASPGDPSLSSDVPEARYPGKAWRRHLLQYLQRQRAGVLLRFVEIADVAGIH